MLVSQNGLGATLKNSSSLPFLLSLVSLIDVLRMGGQAQHIMTAKAQALTIETETETDAEEATR